MPVSVKPAEQKACANEAARNAQAREAAGGNCETNESRFVAPDKPAHMHGNAEEEFKFRNRPLLWPQGGHHSGLYPIRNKPLSRVPAHAVKSAVVKHCMWA